MSLALQENPMPAGIRAPFNPEIAAQVCALSADGKMLPVIAKEIGLSVDTINRWRQLHPSFARAFEVARDQGLDVLVDQLPSIALEHTPHVARILSDNIKWIAERRARKRYGAQLDVNLTTIDVGGALLEARKRAALQPISNLAPALEAQDVDYTMLPAPCATDNESAALPPGTPNPFD